MSRMRNKEVDSDNITEKMEEKSEKPFKKRTISAFPFGKVAHDRLYHRRAIDVTFYIHYLNANDIL